jgi:soluble lytic murein transglycosylase-like protein
MFFNCSHMRFTDMKHNRISTCTAVLALALFMAGVSADAKKREGVPTSDGGKLIVNSVKSGPVELSDALTAAEKSPTVKPARSIVLGAPKQPLLPTASSTEAADGLTFASRLQYVERLMAQAGFSNFKQPLDVSSFAQGQGPVSNEQLAAISNSYAVGSQPLVVEQPFLDNAAAHPTAATLSCMEFPYKPTGIMSSQNEYNRQILFPHVRKAACDAGIPVGLFDALIVQESRYNALARSHKDAFGLAQLMPATANELGVNRYTIHDNLRGGAKLLRRHLDDYGQVHLALAAYNAGPGNVAKYNGIPPFRETRNYVSTILDMWSQMSSY